MSLTLTKTLTAKIGTRSFFHWVNMIFNQVDVERRKLVGPDRSCAEWLLRNGASIKWVGSKGYLTDYNCLPIEGSPTYYIEEVDATESSISHYGFEHFKDCKHVRKLILHKCNYIEDKALKELHYLKDTLRFLQVSSCHNVTEKGLDYLTVLNKLETLIIFDLPYVKEKDFVVDKLCKEVPKCNVQFN